MNTTKISNEMFPLNELREKFRKNIRSTGFTSGTKPSAIVNFHLFNLLSNRLSDSLSKNFSMVIEKALQNLSFYTTGGRFALKDVDYIFIDEENRLVVVLQSGKDYVMLTPPKEVIQTQIRDVSPLKLIVSTYALKEYFTENIDKYPSLKTFSNLCDKNIPLRSMITSEIKKSVDFMVNLPSITEIVDSCIKELNDLLDHASFILCKKRNNS